MSCGYTKKRANSSRTTTSASSITPMTRCVAVHVGPEEVLDGAIGGGHQRREADHRRSRGAHLVRGCRRRGAKTARAFADHVLDQPADQAAHQFVGQPRRLDAGILVAHLAQQAADHRQAGKIGEREQLGAQSVIEIVRVIGDIICDRRDLRFGARVAPEREIEGRVEVGDALRHAALAIFADRIALGVGQRAVVLDDPFERFPGQIQPVEAGIAPLGRGDGAQGLGVVVEAAEVPEAGIERPLAGMPERRVAEVVRQRQRLGQVLVERRACARARGRSG